MENTKRIIEAFFNSKDKIVYGFDVLQTFYKNVCTIIGENKTIPHKIYPLLSSLNGSIQDVFSHVDLNYLCDVFCWCSFIQNVLMTSDSMSQDERRNEIHALIQLNKLVGMKLANCELEVKERWYECLQAFDYITLKQEHQEIVAKCIFSFFESQILFDNHNLISKYFYDRLLKDEYNISECFVRVFLLTSCYLYYLACREDDRFVNGRDRDLRSRSKMIVEQSIDKFKTMLVTIAYRDVNLNSVAPFATINIFNADLFSYMKKSLRSCEHYFIEESKTLIMDNVVEEFLSHIFVYMKCNTPILNITIDKIMNDEQAENLFLMFKTNSEIDKSHKSFLKFFNSVRYEKLYKLFIKALESVYKRNLFKKGLKPKDENYQIIEEEISRRISDVLGQYENGVCDNFTTSTVFSSASIPDSYELEMLLGSFMDCILENIIIALYNRMRKSNETILFKRSKLVDEDLLKLIEKHNGHMFIGGEGQLQPNDFYSYYDRCIKAVNGLSKKHNVAGRLGVFIDSSKFKIFIKDISVSRDAKTIQDCDVKEVDGKYEYAPTGIKMTFTKKELEEYLKSYESVLNISADVGYIIAPEIKVDFILMDM